MLQNKGHNEIHDNGRPKRKKRQINKIHTDVRCLYAEFFAPPFTNAKCLLLEPVYNFIDHFYKYRKFVYSRFFYTEALSKNSATAQRRQPFFEQSES